MFDLVISGGTIIDGTGAPRFVADVGVSGDQIAAVGDLRGSAARATYPAAGKIVTPGFIDAHTHDDYALFFPEKMRPKVTQGVTTVVTGNCGTSLAPLVLDRHPPSPHDLIAPREGFRFESFGAYLRELDKAPLACGVMALVGHGTLRTRAMADVGGNPTEMEIRRMTDDVEEAMEAGAGGLSTGLFYPHSSSATSTEVERLLAVVGRHGGVYTSHMRDEGDALIASIDETCAVAERTGVRLVISHLKCASPRVWGQARRTLELIDRWAERIDIAFDVYPYSASSTMIRPDRLSDARAIKITWSEPHPEMNGRDLTDVAGCWCCSPAEAARRLAPGGAIYFKMEERDVETIMAHPNAMIGSDGLPFDTMPHPRLWGTFPRVLGYYVRDRKLFSLEEAVRRMTGRPAQVFGLDHRGAIRVGARADLVVLDEENISDTATYEDGTARAQGIECVYVGGQAAFANNDQTGVNVGEILTPRPRRNIVPDDFILRDGGL